MLIPEAMTNTWAEMVCSRLERIEAELKALRRERKRDSGKLPVSWAHPKQRKGKCGCVIT
jgi:hypothetical protein